MKNKSLKKILIVILLLVLVSLILLFIDKSSYKDYTRNYFYFDTYINVKVNTVKSEREMNDIFNDIDYLYEIVFALILDYSMMMFHIFLDKLRLHQEHNL